MKKLILGFSLLLSSAFAFSQNGLERVTVEKFYIADANDAAASVAAGDVTPLTVNSVTYRIYADMLPNWRVTAIYWDQNHQLSISTPGAFYNSSAGGPIPAFGRTTIDDAVNALDSWITMGSATTVTTTQANWGVLKADDNTANTVNYANLNNTDPNMGLPLTTIDGMYMTGGTGFPALGPIAPVAAFANASGLEALLGDPDPAGRAFAQGGFGDPFSAGSWYNAGSVGGGNPCFFPSGTENRVLIGQFTVLGRAGLPSDSSTLRFALNVQISNNTTNVSQYYAHANLQAGEFTTASLKYASDVVPTPPTVSITSPANGTNVKAGNSIAVTATAADAGGSVAQVEFFQGATSLGVDATAPYSVNWTAPATLGNYIITAVATDNEGLTTTSTAVTLVSASNPSPNVAGFAVTPGSVKPNRTINFSATVTDDGSVASVVFRYNSVNITPSVVGNVYSASATTVAGQNQVTITATDNEGAVATQNVSFVLNPNTPPTVSVSAPLNNVQANINAAVVLNVVASDDETVSSVQYFVNGVASGSPLTVSPFNSTWTPTAEGAFNITAVATDNDGVASAVSSAVRVNVIDPSAMPYQITSINKKCSDADLFYIPVVALKSVANVIGYDMVMKFNPAKVLPTNVVVLNNDLIDSTLATASLSVAGDSILIQVSMNSNAPEGTFFNGLSRAGGRQVVAVEFAKTNNFLPSDTARFTVRKLEESYYTAVLRAPQVGPGMYTSYKDSLFYGSLKFWNGNDGMGYTAGSNLISRIFGNINLVNFVTPNAAGNFVYSINRGQSISIRRDIADLTSVQSVINGMDGLLTQKVLLDDASFKPSVFQAVAMDVNIDGRISAGDLSQISQRSVRRIAEYKQAWNYNDAGVKTVLAPSKDWLFINDSTLALNPSYLISANYPSTDNKGFSKYFVPKVDTLIALPIRNYATCPIISGQTFRGVLLGDVNGSYKTLPSSASLKSAKAEVIFDMANAIETESTIEVPVYVASSEAQALDFTITVSDNLEFAGVENKVDGNYVVSSFEGSKEVSLFSFGKYSTDKASVIVRFNKLGAVSASDLAINAAYINGKKVGAGISTKLISNDVKIYPNPASKELNVIASEASMVQILDLNGKVVVEGLSDKSLNVEGLTSGIYMVKVSNKAGVKTQKVVIK